MPRPQPAHKPPHIHNIDTFTAFLPSLPLQQQNRANMANAPITMTCEQLTELLRPMMQQHLQARQGQDQAGSEPAGDQTEELLARLQKHLAAYVQGSHSIQAKGMPLPEVDEQLLPLQQQVEAVMQSVASHRASVPDVISKALEQQLHAMRPDGCAVGAAAAGGDDAVGPTDQAASGATTADNAAEVAHAHQLQEALRAALNKLPALRARLEEMDVRLTRNLEAVDAAHAHAEQAPRTVERVLRSVAAGGKGRRAQGGGGAAVGGPAAASQDE